SSEPPMSGAERVPATSAPCWPQAAASAASAVRRQRRSKGRPTRPGHLTAAAGGAGPDPPGGACRRSPGAGADRLVHPEADVEAHRQRLRAVALVVAQVRAAELVVDVLDAERAGAVLLAVARRADLAGAARAGRAIDLLAGVVLAGAGGPLGAVVVAEARALARRAGGGVGSRR